MFEKVLSKNAKQSLAILGKSRLLDSAYLAGGTALALQLGHRYSYDFDFFIPEKFDENIITQRISELLSDFILERKEWGTILGYSGDTRFSLFYFNYPLLFETLPFSGINIADIKDIVPMKIAAIADRGTKRDFIDLYFIFSESKIMDINEAFDLYDKKFKALKQNKVHILKSLVYFNDAEKDPMPQMIKKVKWSEVKNFFIRKQKKFTDRILGV
ncbi:MAG: nucleotidyl transferase AbiEii/AbiGii toxin family protein [Nitrospirota bacterium]